MDKSRTVSSGSSVVNQQVLDRWTEVAEGRQSLSLAREKVSSSPSRIDIYSQAQAGYSQGLQSVAELFLLAKAPPVMDPASEPEEQLLPGIRASAEALSALWDNPYDNELYD